MAAEFSWTWWLTPLISVLREADTGRSLSLSPAWSTKQVPGQPGLHRESTVAGNTLSQKNRERDRKRERERERERLLAHFLKNISKSLGAGQSWWHRLLIPERTWKAEADR